VADAAISQVMGMLDAGSKKGPPPVGLRMYGTYTGTGGLEIEFQPESAVVGCGDAVLAMPYAVERKENQIRIDIQGPVGPVVLTLGADGKLSGSGQVQVNGKRRSASCALGVLVAGETGAGGGVGSKGGANPAKGNVAGTSPARAPASASKPAGGSAPAAPMATANAPTGNAVLAIAGVFDVQAGTPNPSAGHTYMLLRDSYAAALVKGGFQVPAGLTPAKATALACANRSPDCQTAGAALNADGAAGVRMDASGKATFPGVPAGSYHLIGSVHYNNQFLYWDIPVQLKAGANSLRLDPSNAMDADH
jgi:hypothetical protein